MKFFLLFCLLLGNIYCETIEKQYFDPTKYAISSATFMQKTLQTANLAYFNHTLPMKMSDSTYNLLIGISQLNTWKTTCHIQVTLHQDKLSVQVLDWPLYLYKCAFRFLAIDRQITAIQGFYHVLIDNSTKGIVSLNRLGLKLNATYYSIPKPTNKSFIYPRIVVMVQCFSSSQNSLKFSVQGYYLNSSHINISLGSYHNLERISISFIIVQIWQLSYFMTDEINCNILQPTFQWDDNQTRLAIIGLVSLNNFTSIIFSSSDSFSGNGFFTYIPTLSNSIKIVRIQLLLESCSYGSVELNATTCQILPGFYKYSDNLCSLCHYSCFTCTNYTNVSCTNCRSEDFRQLNNSKCLCILGYFDVQYQYSCKKCPNKCTSCNNQTSCLTCIDNNQVALPNTLCVCMPGFIQQSPTNSTCIPCDSICKTCSSSPSNCTLCKNSILWRLSNGICRCITGYFDPGTEVCQKCSRMCSSCISELICLKCYNYSLIQFVNQTCTCQIGSFFKSTAANCQLCSNQCLTCSNSTVCLSCDNSKFMYLSGNNCLCQAGYYKQSGVCHICTSPCLTCSSASVCLSCNDSHFRQINGSGCLCQSGYYDSGGEKCLVCPANCKTCSSALICLSCHTFENRILTNSTCVCLDGFYDQQQFSVCQQCALNCLTCVNYLTCMSCNTTQLRFINDSNCLCLPGYYQTIQSLVCQACNKPCLTCSSDLLCLSCEKGDYILLEGKCIISKSIPSMRIYNQNINEVLVIINFPVKISFQQDTSNIIYVSLDEVPIQIQILETYSEFILFKFDLKRPSKKLTAEFKNGSLTDANTKAILSYEKLSLNLQYAYCYSEIEVQLLRAVDNVVEKASELVTYGRLGGVVFKLVNVFLDLIEYIHQISFYVFLDCDLPSNLRKVFSTLYNALQYNILPISVDVPGADYDGFDQPEVYSKQDFSFNFLANCFLLVVQLCVSTLIYIAIGKLFASVKSKSAVVKFFRGNFSRTIYSNCVDALSASQLPLCFASAVTLIDRNFSHPLKVVNFACGILFVFVVSFFPLINPLFLFSVKRSRAIDTESCYANTQKHAKLSEYYLFSKAVLSFCVAVFIPLSSAKTAVLLLLSACLFQIFYGKKTTFKSKFYRVVRLIYLSSNTISHVLLVVLVFAPLELQVSIGIGYAIIVLILFNMFLDVVQVLANLMSICHSLFQKCRQRFTVIVPNDERPPLQIKKTIKFVHSLRATRSNVMNEANINNKNADNTNCFTDTQNELNIKMKTKQIRLDQYSPNNGLARSRKVKFYKRYGDVSQSKLSNVETVKLPSKKVLADQLRKTSKPRQFVRNISDDPFCLTSRN